ncbi:MAG: DUF6261 family protein [Capnocytophaga sp.]|nr:DUF6261 family protein [Capnocytophaga sp.]
MIKASYLKDIRLMEFFALMTNTKDYALSEDLETLKLKDFFENDFMVKYNAFDAVLVGVRKSGYTEKINELKTKRDGVIVGLNAHIRAYENFPDAASSEAAKRIKNIVEGFGKNIQSLGLSEKTGIIINLLSELDATEVKKDIQKIGATRWIDELRTLNNEFQKVFKDRISYEASVETGKVQEARNDMQKSFTELCKRINALALLENKDDYQKLSDNINREVDRAKQIAKGRSKKTTPKENEL